LKLASRATTNFVGFKPVITYHILLFLSIEPKGRSQGLRPFSKPISETGINRFKTETIIKTETGKNWIPVLNSKSKP